MGEDDVMDVRPFLAMEGLPSGWWTFGIEEVSGAGCCSTVLHGHLVQQEGSKQVVVFVGTTSR
jgi:hypothetical protein